MSNYYDRYQRGERIEVWSDLIALGEAVRQEPVYSDAVAVARETMTRARQNVETLITRLDGIGYEFMTRRRSLQMLTAHMESLQEFAAKQLKAVRTNQFRGYELLEALQPGFVENQFLPAVEQIANSPRMQGLIEFIRAGESAESPANSLESIYNRGGKRDAEFENVERTPGGPLPISLRAWSEAVSYVSFLGSHPILNPSTIVGFGAGAPYTERHVAQIEPTGFPVTTEWPAPNVDESALPYPLVLNRRGSRGQGFLRSGSLGRNLFLIAPDIGIAKAGSGVSYGIRVPDRSADAVFGDWKKGFFVEYLRRVFAWGGFPGWERLPNPPMDLIRELTHGLQSI